MAIQAGMVSAIANAATSGLNFLNQGWTNRKNRAFAQDMYNQQRDHANADWQRNFAANIDMWNMNNQYNEYLWNKQNEFNIRMRDEQRAYDSPAAQMERFRQAGINPNAMFGNLSSGGAIDAASMPTSSAPSAPSSRGSSFSVPSSPAAQFSGNPIGAYFDTKIKQAQVDNLRAQNDILVQDQILKTLDVTGKAIANDTAGVNNQLLRDTYITSVDAARENLRKIRNDIDIDVQRNNREAAMQPYTMEKIISDIRTARVNNQLTISQTDALGIEKDLKRIQLEMSKMGIQPNDKLWQRMLGRFFTAPIFKEGGKTIKSRVLGLLNQADDE